MKYVTVSFFAAIILACAVIVVLFDFGRPPVPVVSAAPTQDTSVTIEEFRGPDRSGFYRITDTENNTVCYSNYEETNLQCVWKGVSR